MPKERQHRYCEHSGRWVTPLETEEMHDSLHTVWWLCPACGDWHAEFSEERKTNNGKWKPGKPDIAN